jgi:hypothetical protein
LGLPSVNGELANSAVASGCSASDAELLHHVRFARIVEVGLDGAGAQHHVEAHGADARHVPQHDGIAALGHDRQFFAGLVRPHAKAEETETGARADRLHLIEVAPGFGAGLVQVFQRRARQFELARRFEADGAVAARMAMTLPPSITGSQPNSGQRHQQIADAAGLVIGRGVVIGGADRRAFRVRCRCASGRAAFRPQPSARPAGRGFRSQDRP